MSEEVKRDNKDYYLRSPWAKHYMQISKRCNNGWYKRKGIKNYIRTKDVKFLWFRDKAYKLKRPSVDRIDNEGHYTIENCRFIELMENIIRGQIKYRKPCASYKNSKLVKKFESICHASRYYGFRQCDISNCCNKKNRVAINGYGFKFTSNHFNNILIGGKG